MSTVFDDQQHTARHAVATLFRVSGAAAIGVAVANVVLLAVTAEFARVRDLELVWGLRRLLEYASLQPFAYLPSLLSVPFALDRMTSLLCLSALAILINLVVVWLLALVLAPMVVLAVRVSRQAHERRSEASWLWTRAYPLAVLLGFLSPAVLAWIHWLNRSGSSRVTVFLTVAIVGLGWAGLFAVGDARRVRQLIRVLSAGGIVVTASALGGAAIALVLGGRFGGPIQPPAPPGQPNILLVSIDSLRHDHVHSYGYPRETTPNIDTLAAEGVRFATVVSPSSWTLPTHVTLLTSLPPEQHGVTQYDSRMRPETRLLSEVLWDRGYTTAGFVSGSFLDGLYGFSKGFDMYDDYTLVKSLEPASFHGITSPKLLGVVETWLQRWDTTGRQRPFFLFMHMWDVHYDYTPPPPYDSMFDPDYRGTVTGEDFEVGTQVHKDMDRRDLEHVIALYDGEIRFTDLYLGKLLDTLKAMGVFNDTIVIVTADHGDEFFEHGMKGHAKQLYDETILVPLLVRYPKKIPAGKVVDAQVRLMDVAPTILSLAGLEQPGDFGVPEQVAHAQQDLTPLILADPGTPAPALVAFSDLKGYLASMRTRRFKLISHTDKPTAGELYDLSEDPGERTNVIGREPGTDKELGHELFAWRQRWRGSATASQHVQLTGAQKERLRALGYIQ